MTHILKTSLGSLNSISINLDTNYRDWINAFPGISICLNKGLATSPIKSYLQNVTKKSVPISIIRTYQSLLFLNRVNPSEGIKIEEFVDFNKIHAVNITDLKENFLPQSCNDFMESVTFLEKEVPCDKIFIKHETEIGTCFIANGMHDNLEDYQGLPLTYRNNQPVERSLVIKYIESKFWSYKLFTHPPEETPSEMMEPIVLRNSEAQTFIGLKTIEILNDKNIKHESIAARNCRYPFEKFEDFDMPYSLANCVQLKKIKLELTECGCTLPIGDLELLKKKAINLCDVEKFKCIEEFTKVLKLNFKKHIEECLVPSCPSMEITNIAEYSEKIDDEPFGILKIQVMAKPSLRYIRRVVFSKLDMIDGKGSQGRYNNSWNDAIDNDGNALGYEG
ncbi:uncharacterized protein [Chironomus tepperi]|uniref:uncharacterized protein n=1 Tax=Chironomus tepperi TaxID=113505 RepID=UPI00391FB83F